MLQPHLTDRDLLVIAAVLMLAVTGFGTICWAAMTALFNLWENWKK